MTVAGQRCDLWAVGGKNAIGRAFSSFRVTALAVGVKRDFSI
jgi:hypothetical protein